jgi:FkbM family methyltransferase
MMLAKRLVNYLPAPAQRTITAAWRKIRGNPELHVLKILSDPTMLAIDVGANAGDYAHWLARHSRGCVAFEPNPELAQLVEHRYGGAGVQVFAYALSDHSGQATLRVPVIDGQECPALATVEPANVIGGMPMREVVVPLRRLDDLELATVGVIKIDAEGHELAVLGGAQVLIARDRPSVMIEVEERHKPGSVAAVRSFFDARGYVGFFLVGRRVAPIGQFDPNLHQDTSWVIGDTVAVDKTYVNTFIFTASPHLTARLNEIVRSGASL